ncbi:MAG: electron transfer flavoprotein subunit alpha/FixB family protein [Deltaproteobacteria bacterium]|nr:electron transfer flavoprotein subunit alpha/FixB family protein [Deltaproteobacteria bacterium]
MSEVIFAYIIHSDGNLDDTSLEMVTAAKKISPNASLTALVFGSGQTLDPVCQQLYAAYQEIWKIDDPALAYPNAELIRPLMVRILPENSIVLVPHEHFGMDLSPGLSVKLDVAYLPDAVDIQGVENGKLIAVREEYNGQVSTHVACDISRGAVITIRPGAFHADEAGQAHGQVVDKTEEALAGGLPEQSRRFIELVQAEVGDVDITRSDVLVSVGRGIEDEENLEIVSELANAIGADLSCSRPIVDAKWMEKSRQVGTSGQTVKPKVYLALGISGSFQHMGGVKGAPFIVAVNKNPKAPIFQLADVGVVANIMEFVPKLTEKIKEAK